MKQGVSDIYEQLGMDLPTEFRMFMKRSKLVKGLPFEATLPEQIITRADGLNAFYEASMEKRDDRDIERKITKQKGFIYVEYLTQVGETKTNDIVAYIGLSCQNGL